MNVIRKVKNVINSTSNIISIGSQHDFELEFYVLNSRPKGLGYRELKKKKKQYI